MIFVSVLKNAYKVFENILFEKMFISEKIYEQGIKSSLPTKVHSYSFYSPLEIVLSIPLVVR